MLTKYIGKIVENRTLLICKDSNGNLIQCPSVKLFVKNQLQALTISEGQEPVEPYKRLTEQEVAQFFTGSTMARV